MSFWESSFMWLEAVIASTALAAVCAVVGVYTIMRRVVFLPAALSQISGFGVTLAFLIVAFMPALEHSSLVSPEVITTVVTLGAALALGWMPEPRRLGREAVIGIASCLGGGAGRGKVRSSWTSGARARRRSASPSGQTLPAA